MSKKVQRSLKINRGVTWVSAPDVKRRLEFLISKTESLWLKPKQIFAFRSSGAKTRAFARIWGLPRIWQLALKEPPYYIIEVITEKYDQLPEAKKDSVLLHEIAHIPKKFSGALVPHIRRGKRKFTNIIDQLTNIYRKNK